MAFADVQAVTNFTGFSAADETTILGAMETAYNGSATAKGMFDAWIATATNTIEVEFVAGAFQAFTNTGRIQIDLSFLTNASYIGDDGTAETDTVLTAVMHELVHALTGRTDNYDLVMNYKGDTVDLSNMIYSELSIPEQNSYIAYDNTGNILTDGYMYTNGAAIDRSIAGDYDQNSSAAGNSDDLLIGGPGANILQSGDGDDYLFGAGGDDDLRGGTGTDTVVLDGDPIDYDIRLNPDNTWTSRHVRGDADEGTDKFTNLEKVMFSGGATFDLAKNGLDFQTDIAFVIDTTGSMFDDIAAVKASANGVINALFDGATDARIGIVGFKDAAIGEPTQVLLSFTDQDVLEDRKTAALNAINAISTGGGGDFPETAFDGLLKALDGTMGDWRPGAAVKRVALFTDATAKDAAVAPAVLALATNLGATISSSATTPLGDMGVVDTFELDMSMAARDLISHGEAPPEFMVTDEMAEEPSTKATVQIVTIFIEGFVDPDPAFVDISAATGGTVLEAADPAEVVEKLLEVIESTSYFLSVDPTSVAEGDAGTTDLMFTLTRDSGDLAATATLVASGSADAADVTVPPLEVEFAVGETSKTILVEVNGDTDLELDETFALAIDSVSEPALFSAAAVSATIINDDTDEPMTSDPTPEDYDAVLIGDENPNPLMGTELNEWIDGKEMRDNINGGAGDDYIIAGPGNDWYVRGGSGADIFQFGLGDNDVKIHDWESGIDKIFLVDGLSFSDFEISGAASNLIMVAPDGGRLMFQGLSPEDISEDDFMEAMGSTKPGPDDYENVFEGDETNNPIQGTDDGDYIEGFEGRDDINGMDGDDFIAAGSGNDWFVRGGAGADIFAFGVGDDDIKIHGWEDGIDMICLTGGLSFEDLTMSTIGTNTVFSTAEGDRLMFADVDPLSIGSEDFLV